MKKPNESGNTKLIRRRDVLAGALGAATVLVIRPGAAKAAKWPDKPVTLVIMYAAGGGTDVVMRLIAKEMAVAKGWSIEPINKPGAVGGIATNYVLQQPADGYTLLGAANFNKFVRVMGHTNSKCWEDWTIMQAASSLASWSVREESEFKTARRRGQVRQGQSRQAHALHLGHRRHLARSRHADRPSARHHRAVRSLQGRQAGDLGRSAGRDHDRRRRRA